MKIYSKLRFLFFRFNVSIIFYEISLKVGVIVSALITKKMKHKIRPVCLKITIEQKFVEHFIKGCTTTISTIKR